jgi:hypothetical protein
MVSEPNSIYQQIKHLIEMTIIETERAVEDTRNHSGEAGVLAAAKVREMSESIDILSHLLYGGSDSYDESE